MQKRTLSPPPQHPLPHTSSQCPAAATNTCHHGPYTTIGVDINITWPPPTPKTYQPEAEDILNTITANADNNLQCHECGKLGPMHKPSTPNTHFIHGDRSSVNSTKKTWYSFLSPLKPWARFGPMLQAFLITTHHPRQKSWRI